MNGSYGVVSSKWHLEKLNADDQARESSGSTAESSLPSAGEAYSCETKEQKLVRARDDKIWHTEDFAILSQEWHCLWGPYRYLVVRDAHEALSGYLPLHGSGPRFVFGSVLDVGGCGANDGEFVVGFLPFFLGNDIPILDKCGVGVNLHAILFVAQDFAGHGPSAVWATRRNVEKGHQPNLAQTGTTLTTRLDNQLGHILTNRPLFHVFDIYTKIERESVPNETNQTKAQCVSGFHTKRS